MPKDSSSNDEILSKAVGSAVGWTLGVSALPFYYLAKRIWRGLVFTGLWPLLILLFLFGFYPSSALSFPILFAFMFSIFWTGKNLVGLRAYPSRDGWVQSPYHAPLVPHQTILRIRRF